MHTHSERSGKAQSCPGVCGTSEERRKMDPLQQQLKLMLLLLSCVEETLMAAHHTDEAPSEELCQRYTSSLDNFAAGVLDGNESFCPPLLLPPPNPSPTPPHPVPVGDWV